MFGLIVSKALSIFIFLCSVDGKHRFLCRKIALDGVVAAAEQHVLFINIP